jgi:sugar phosphate isomerase/epimerase
MVAGLSLVNPMPLDLSLNLATVRRQWKLPDAVAAAARHGFAGVAPWRDMVEETGVAEAARIFAGSGRRVTGYCRGGLFGSGGAAKFQEAVDDNRRMIDQAVAIGAECIVVIGGGLAPGSRDLPAARAMFADGLAAVLPHARAASVPLALEPMHPMYAADRGCVTSLREMLDIAEALGNDGLGIAVDTYHVWWDPELVPQLARAGRRIIAHHICDWLVPTRHLLNDRGMMGDGVIDFPAIRRMVEEAGYRGIQEVEIFSEDWWSRPGDEVLATAVERFRTVCMPEDGAPRTED